jgi:hypothetical protein
MGAMSIGAIIATLIAILFYTLGYSSGKPDDKTLSDKKIREINRIINPR